MSLLAQANARLRILGKFQKCLRRADAASTPGEAEAAEAAARRLMEVHDIDPVALTNKSFHDDMDFSDSALLKKLREEWRAAHPDYWYGKPDKNGGAQRLKHKPRPKPEPVNTTKSKPKPKPETVNTTKTKNPRSADRHLDPNQDRHRPGYMAEYMRRRRAAEKP